MAIETNLEQIRLRLKSDDGLSARKSIASFLFMVMPVDGETHPRELERLQRILADDFDLCEDATQKLIEQVSGQSATHESVMTTAEHLKTVLSTKEILALVSHLWEMVFADGRLHESEVILVERLSMLLGVDQDDVAKAMAAH